MPEVLPWCYRLSGLRVRTDVPLPAPQCPADSSVPDLVIQRGTVPLVLPGSTVDGPGWTAAADRVLLVVPGIVRMLMDRGESVLYESESGIDPADVVPFLLGSAVGISLHLRGGYVLHGSAVEVDGKAVIFCGRGGVGKSTIAAWLAAHDCTLLADDMCLIEDDGAVLRLQPRAVKLKLWKDSFDFLGWPHAGDARIRSGIDKFWAEPIGPVPDAAVTVGAIVFVHPAGRGATWRPAGAVEAAELLRVNAFRPRLVQALQQEPLWLRMAARLITSVPMLQFWQPDGLQELPAALSNLLPACRQRQC